MYGRHLLIDFYDCTGRLLNDPKLVEETLLKSAEVAKATILEHCFHQFAPQGVSGVVVIAESHISIHTWPEEGYAAIDIFTCGQAMRPEAAIALMKAVFEPAHVDIKDLQRGQQRDLRLAIKELRHPEDAAIAEAGLEDITVPNHRLSS